MWQGKFGCDLHTNFENNIELKRHCQGNFSVISDVLSAMEEGVRNTATNYFFFDENQQYFQNLSRLTHCTTRLNFDTLI